MTCSMIMELHKAIRKREGSNAPPTGQEPNLASTACTLLLRSSGDNLMEASFALSSEPFRPAQSQRCLLQRAVCAG